MNATIEGNSQAPKDSRKTVWIRGLYMVFFVIAISITQTLINVIALVQFLSMLLLREPNEMLKQFGASLGRWLQQVTAFQSGATEDKPFPWAAWPTEK
ncbi:MAG: DUF4389 domain-containing protein [Pseudomonadota bacterium]